MPRNRNFPRLVGVLILPMTPSLLYQPPAVGFDPIHNIPEFHLDEN
jgi:hypothetical protein